MLQVINGNSSIQATGYNIGVCLIKIETCDGFCLLMHLKNALWLTEIPNLYNSFIISRDYYLLVGELDPVDRVLMCFFDDMGYFASRIDKAEPLIFWACGKDYTNLINTRSWRIEVAVSRWRLMTVRYFDKTFHIILTILQTNYRISYI